MEVPGLVLVLVLVFDLLYWIDYSRQEPPNYSTCHRYSCSPQSSPCWKYRPQVLTWSESKRCEALQVLEGGLRCDC